jgi:hypothetical protein
MDALDVLATVHRYRESVMDGNALDHQHAVLSLDLADRLDLEPLTPNLDLTRFQRAGEGARQSPAGGCDDVIKRRGVRWILVR